MAVIQSGATTDLWTIDPTSKAGRVTMYSSAGAEIIWPFGSTGSATPARAVLIGGDDGTNLKGLITGSAANLISTGQLGDQALGIVHFTQWAITNAPAVATKATVSRAANVNGRHVATAYCTSYAAAGTSSTAVLTWSIRDGATGAGTVLWTGVMSQAAISNQFTAQQSGLALAGSTNTAMTIEFGAAGTTASAQAVSLAGFDTE